MRRPRGTAPIFGAVAVSYALNCGLGAAVSAKLVDTSGYRWLHHLLYIVTCTSAAAAVVAACCARPRRVDAALILAPAAVPLAAVAFLGARGPRHPIVALAAAPFIAASLLRSRQPADRS
ncbi:hypothetical protein KVY00_12285 [Leucobacter tenebrionis]|nr:hypothetical protein KVY00_12285 [Leucobacter tenebrionis]